MTRVCQELLSHPEVLQASLLRHMTSGLILSSALNAGPNPVVTGAGEEITVTKHPGRPFIAIASKASGGNEVDKCIYFLYSSLEVLYYS